MEQRTGDRDLLAHPLAEASDPAIPHLGQVDDPQVAIHGAPQGRPGQAIEAAVVGKVLAGGELLVEPGRLGEDAADGSNASRVRPQLQAVDPRRTR